MWQDGRHYNGFIRCPSVVVLLDKLTLLVTSSLLRYARCADPHPGNIAVSATGDLIFYDFGMMCETAKSKDDLLDVFFGIYEKDTNKVRMFEPSRTTLSRGSC